MVVWSRPVSHQLVIHSLNTLPIDVRKSNAKPLHPIRAQMIIELVFETETFIACEEPTIVTTDTTRQLIREWTAGKSYRDLMCAQSQRNLTFL
ncbi:unnamed protein product [Oppiella nova]|uniref:Uncharacterized protein n=1 Tax=Oppiella nova TaxID=334625 RepID=A0A7R9LMC0_9ACAR|nr:unnamed protein product [Oppiella nova]CAG2165067.1 unnamed protein product [Oppiella nova]